MRKNAQKCGGKKYRAAPFTMPAFTIIGCYPRLGAAGWLIARDRGENPPLQMSDK